MPSPKMVKIIEYVLHSDHFAGQDTNRKRALKNPNVMYETGIAHTLGKHVIPITQAVEDIPFDIRHHRVLKYLPNKEGYASLSSKLGSRLRQIFFPGMPT
jgi:hypothetical protein